ncbi:hypothetical protein VS868_12095 [Salinimicrobium sp. 3283s]|uniref:hypothetical protein n=1 Tax=Salinimicrobium sp. 3283s TaxID=3114359 RepID=UPI0031F0EEE4
MNLKFTASNFELDLYGLNLNIVEENHWFSDQFFTKYSFPVEFDVTDELDAALQMITHNNAARSAKTFPGYLELFGKEPEALLVIERIQGRKAQGKFRYGFEEFPNYDKKLSELDLEREELNVPITDFALPFLNKTYPEVNYNFPQAIVDKFDTSTAQWQYFEGILNNFSGGAFLVNEFDTTTQEQINRNIMQPFPYLLYVIAQGFAEKGLELRGEILTDPDLKDAVIPIISDYYSTASEEGSEWVVKANQYDNLEMIEAFVAPFIVDVEVGNYSKTIPLDSPGVYKIAGNAILRSEANTAVAEIKLDGRTVWKAAKKYVSYREYFFSIDRNVEISVEAGSGVLTFTSQQLPYAEIDKNQDPEAIILDLTITKIAGYDQDGELVPTVVSPKEINLQKCVPDMTFGELLKVVKNWKNYDIAIGEGFVEMNKIQNQMKSAEVVDLSGYEVKYPVRKFYQDNTFLLQFQEVSSEEYTFEKVFVDATGSRTSSFVKREDTQEITIKGLPLPLKQKGPVNTAHLFTDANNILILAIYPGLVNDLNLCRDASNLLVPAVYESDWREWLDFRINAEGFEWEFEVYPELAGKISRDSKIAAYGRSFIVRRVSKKNTSRWLWMVSLECDGVD